MAKKSRKAAGRGGPRNTAQARSKCREGGRIRRRHKDGLFCRLFAEKENALSLYNALTGSSYTSADGLEIVTLEDAVYLSQKNDCAVCVQSSLALFEQQSSWNPNMPLRGLLYVCRHVRGEGADCSTSLRNTQAGWHATGRTSTREGS